MGREFQKGEIAEYRDDYGNELEVEILENRCDDMRESYLLRVVAVLDYPLSSTHKTFRYTNGQEISISELRSYADSPERMFRLFGRKRQQEGK